MDAKEWEGEFDPMADPAEAHTFSTIFVQVSHDETSSSQSGQADHTT
jgi:hypothetical protein